MKFRKGGAEEEEDATGFHSSFGISKGKKKGLGLVGHHRDHQKPLARCHQWPKKKLKLLNGRGRVFFRVTQS